MLEIELFVFLLSVLGGFYLYRHVTKGISDRKNLHAWLPEFRIWALFIFVVLYLFSLISYFFSPNSLPGEPLFYLYEFWKNGVLSHALLGFIFGFIFADWARYLLDPENLLSTDSQQVAHRRWGFVLLAMFVVGVFGDSARFLIANLSGISTPVGSISISQSSQQANRTIVATPPSGKGGNPGNGVPGDELILLKSIKGFISRDEVYSRLTGYLSERSVDRRKWQKSAEEMMVQPFSPLIKCIEELAEVHTDAQYLQAITSDFFHDLVAVRFKLEVQNKKAFELSDGEFVELSNSFNKMIRRLENQVTQVGIGNHEEGEKCGKSISLNLLEKRFRPQQGSLGVTHNVISHLLDLNAPYGALIISAFLSAGGSEDTAALVLGKWIDYQESLSEEEPQISRWHLIRAYIHLGFILEKLGNYDALVLVLQRTIHLMRVVYAGSQEPLIHNIHNWQNNCPSTENDPDGWHIDSLNFTLMTQADQLIEYSLQTNQISLDLLELAKFNQQVGSHCYIHLVPSDVDYFRGRFLANYGILLIELAERGRKTNMLSNDAITRQYSIARIALRQAFELLKGYELSQSFKEKTGKVSEIILMDRFYGDQISRIRSYLERAQATHN
ncbi:MAG: hypothetical protein AAF530_07510 [Pseudomonadota bacterium]